MTNPTNSSIIRDATAWANGGVAIASEDEWYKAAYYQPELDGGDPSNYWLYATARSSNFPGTANYQNDVGALTDVGTYSDYASYYGTFDQAGNVKEWNDTIVNTTKRIERGGAYNNTINIQKSSTRQNSPPDSEGSSVGFRISSLDAVPEPSTYAALFGYLSLSFVMMRRKLRSEVN